MCVDLSASTDLLSNFITLQARLSVSGFGAHAYPVERLAIEPGGMHRLATGAHKELSVWSCCSAGGTSSALLDCHL